MGYCPNGSQNVAEQGSGPICWFTWDGAVNGNGLFGAGAKFKHSVGVTLNAELTQSYVPYAGTYWLRAYLCPSSGLGKCSVDKASEWIGTVQSATLNPNSSVSAQNPNFGGSASTKTISYAFNLCFAISDPDGKIWTSNEGIMCQPDSGASELPDTPAICYINYGHDLDVNMGNIERGEINTSIQYGSEKNVKKNVAVYCHNDTAVTVSTSFSFTPININGNEVIATSSSNLGIALFYNGELVSPSSTPVTETFSSGDTLRELEFQAVRNPDFPSKNIPVGGFTASAVMIMTQQ